MNRPFKYDDLRKRAGRAPASRVIHPGLRRNRLQAREGYVLR